MSPSEHLIWAKSRYFKPMKITQYIKRLKNSLVVAHWPFYTYPLDQAQLDHNEALPTHTHNHTHVHNDSRLYTQTFVVALRF